MAFWLYAVRTTFRNCFETVFFQFHFVEDGQKWCETVSTAMKKKFKMGCYAFLPLDFTPAIAKCLSPVETMGAPNDLVEKQYL